MRQQLRDYQQRGRDRIFDAYREGARSVLCVSPTGSGKTTLFTSIAADLAESHHPSLILVHRRELATQACNRLREFGVQFGLIMAGEQPNPLALVQVASVGTLVRRKAPKARMVICDEAHLSTAETWRKILEQYQDARILGATATPWRLSGKPLVQGYDKSVIVAHPAELREQGHLCPYVGFSYKTPDLSAIKTTGGDYNEAQSAAVMSESLIVDSVVEEWIKHASDLSTVVFAVTVEHSKQLTERFRSAGVAAEHLDGGMPKFQRDSVLAKVASGATRVLVNVGIAVEGLDIPRLKCCVLARPTKSLARAIQMMGRVRRPWNGVTARIHDHAFVIKLHGLPDAERDYELTAKPEKPPSLRQCEECFRLYEGTRCPSCDHENTPSIGEREIQTISDAEKIEFESGKEEAVKVQKPPVHVSWNSPGRILEGRLVRRWKEQTDYGLKRAYFLEGPKRDYQFLGTAHLDALLARVPDGAKVWITYVGPARDSGRKYFKVEIDD